jgi:PTH2 family peptidyl-tRNA hydrolase
MKQIIVLRKDLNMSPGKAAAQACHASLTAYLLSEVYHRKDAEDWLKGGQTKVIVQVEDEAALIALEAKLKEDKKTMNRYALIRDAGHTELKGQNLTALGIGPIPADKIDPYTRKLLLYK